jgi:hypothetical protein
MTHQLCALLTGSRRTSACQRRLTATPMAVGLERAHAQLLGQGEGLLEPRRWRTRTWSITDCCF